MRRNDASQNRVDGETGGVLREGKESSEKKGEDAEGVTAGV